MRRRYSCTVTSRIWRNGRRRSAGARQRCTIPAMICPRIRKTGTTEDRTKPRRPPEISTACDKSGVPRPAGRRARELGTRSGLRRSAPAHSSCAKSYEPEQRRHRGTGVVTRSRAVSDVRSGVCIPVLPSRRIGSPVDRAVRPHRSRWTLLVSSRQDHPPSISTNRVVCAYIRRALRRPPSAWFGLPTEAVA
jgi:hypothetical protein